MKLSAPLLLLSLLTAVGSGSAAAQGPLEGPGWQPLNERLPPGYNAEILRHIAGGRHGGGNGHDRSRKVCYRWWRRRRGWSSGRGWRRSLLSQLGAQLFICLCLAISFAA